MNCRIYREQIIEDVTTLPAEAKIHIQSCLKCKKLYYEYSKFEKIISDAKKTLEQNPNTSLKPQYVINLAFLKKSIQNNLASLKRMYIYATIILIIFIYAFLFNSLQYFDGKKVEKYTETTQVTTSASYFEDDEEELELLDELTSIQKEFLDEAISALETF